MFFHFLYPLAHDYPVFNLFRYITFRTFGALLTALIISFCLGRPFILWLKSRQEKGQPIRDDGPASHLTTKKGTPTMGGALILFSLTVSSLLWGSWHDPYLWIVLMVTLGFGLLGAFDDYLKLTKGNSKGLSSKLKFLAQLFIALTASFMIHVSLPLDLNQHMALPFFKHVILDMGWLFLPFATLVMVGASNAVNLTDGLDGLAIGPVMMVGGCFLIISYVVGNSIFAYYLQLSFVPGAGELAIFCGALLGSGLGFLWFNAPPAQVFMGDTGSLALGGALGAISIICKHELVLAIVGGLFVLETISVILQVISFKTTGKRLFLMAPIHHHFEKKGWAEQTIVIRFWIISLILALIGLSTLKIR